ncbi:hypothetical protein GCM10010841_24260 [Deinococcus aerophilus]|uniref:Lipoprotein n=2 Tax=Deinococcus aerophilus TaxID=522488 RepID=A0ABQ2GV42_9DEIO|nr:hypothetical protein GCM10010841_24260 [Deinococcus aerophilus]
MVGLAASGMVSCMPASSGTQYTDSAAYTDSTTAECKLTPEQDIAAARAVASSAANSALSVAALAYTATYSGVSYKVEITGVGIHGNTAQVGGKVTVKATQRSSGKPVSDTYSGTVNLVREGCGWQASGYTRG